MDSLYQRGRLFVIYCFFFRLLRILFPRRLTASVSKYSICPLTERNSSAAQAASLSYNSSEIRKGIYFFAITVFIKKLAGMKAQAYAEKQKMFKGRPVKLHTIKN